MDNLLNLEDNLKIGKQEILLDPSKTANKCGSTVEPLLANDLMVKQTLEDGTVKYISLTDFITQEHISIDNLQITANGLNVVITWVGTNDVDVIIDGATSAPNGDRKHTVALAPGEHTITVKAKKDLRGLTKHILVQNPTADGVIIITFD